MDEPIDPPLDERQRRFVAGLAKGLSVKDAARQAGYSAGYSAKTKQLMKHPGVARELKAVQQAMRTAMSYDCQAAMLECAAAIEFAKQHKNANAYVKGVELRAKLSGLLIDRVEVFTADLKGAIEQAKERVLHVINPRIRES
jgi:phage terminase small subunit